MKNSKEVLLTDNLMREIADGKAGAFEQLCALTYKPLYNYIFSIVRKSELAEDLLHDTYLTLHRTIHTYTPKDKPMAWIFTIARNLCYNFLRGGNRFEPIEEADQMCASSGSQEEDCLNRQILKELMTRLSEKERTVILLNVVSGYKFREIASLLQEPLGTVLSSYRRGMNKLRDEDGRYRG